jgi:hypothetical protein
MVVRKCAPEKFMRKNLRPLDTKELEGGFGGMQLKIQTNLKDKDGLITKDLIMNNSAYSFICRVPHVESSSC